MKIIKFWCRKEWLNNCPPEEQILLMRVTDFQADKAINDPVLRKQFLESKDIRLYFSDMFTAAYELKSLNENSTYYLKYILLNAKNREIALYFTLLYKRKSVKYKMSFTLGADPTAPDVWGCTVFEWETESVQRVMNIIKTTPLLSWITNGYGHVEFDKWISEIDPITTFRGRVAGSKFGF